MPALLIAVCHSQPVTVLDQQQMVLVDPEFQSVLDVCTLLKLNTTEAHMKDDQEGKADGTEPKNKS